MTPRPAFSIVVITTLGLGIGASTAAFSLVHGILIRSLPYREPDRLVRLFETNPGRAMAREATSVSNFDDWRKRSRSFEAMAAAQRITTLTLTSSTPPLEIRAGAISTNYLDVLGAIPATGRSFAPGEDAEATSRTVVLSDGFWRRQLGARPDVVGSRVQFEAQDFEVIGVLPTSFMNPLGEADVFIPMRIRSTDIDRGQNYLQALARLKRGVDVQTAQAEVDRLALRLAEEFPSANRGRGIAVSPLIEETVAGIRRTLFLVMGAVTLVLLLACANVANLFFLRNVDRRPEIALRSALGAPGSRIVRQLLIEAGTLSFAGGALGLVIATAVVGLVKRLGAGQLPRLLEVQVDGAAFAFSGAMCALTTLLFGLLPCREVLKGVRPESLRAGASRSIIGGPGRGRIRGALVVGQVGLTLILLVGAGLLTRTLANLASVSLGFETKGVSVTRVSLGETYAAPEKKVAYFQEVTEELRRTPGVTAVGAVTVSPLNAFGIDFDVPYHRFEEPEPSRASAAKARFRAATPGYFEAIGMTVVRGRSLSDADRGNAPGVVVINQALAAAAWPGVDPVGRTMRVFWSDWRRYEVIGVVADARSYGLAVAPRPELFVPNAQIPYSVMNIVVRAVDENAVAPRVLEVMRARDPDEPPGSIVSMRELVSHSIAKERFALAWLFGLALVGLILSTIGIYSAVSFATEQRRREIGLRIALGSTPGGVLRLVLRSGAALAVTGVAFGLAGALALNRLIESLLFEVSGADPLTFLVAAVLVLALSLFATAVPARCAARVDPIAALREG